MAQKQLQKQLQKQVRELGSKLDNPPTSKDGLIKLLKQAATCLSELDQSPSLLMMESMQPCLNSIAKAELLKHQDRDVNVLVANCICEITRITAPEAPYSDDVLKDIFQLIVGTFSRLGDVNDPSFGRMVVILETLAKYRSCVVMLDLECDDLVNEMFSTFFSVASDDHPESVLTSMQTIMVFLLDESEDIQEHLLLILLSALDWEKNGSSMAARRLAMNVIQHCTGKLEPCIKQLIVSSMSGDKSSLKSQLNYHKVIRDIYQCAPQILGKIVPYLRGELLTDQLDMRLKAVKFLGDLFALPGHAISETFQPLFSEFLNQLSDREVEVRVAAAENAKNCLLSNPSRTEAPEIITALCKQLHDCDENVRKLVVSAVFDVACLELKSIPAETIQLVAECLRDKSISVKKYTMERLAELYRHYCSKYSGGSVSDDEFKWIPGRILRCIYDRDFRSEAIEVILCGSPPVAEFSIKDKVKYWITVFSGFEKVDMKALEKLLAQKQRLQQEMQKYLSIRQTNQDGDAPELQKRIVLCFRTMSQLFGDPGKAEESFRILHQLKDANIWKILTKLLDPDTSFQQAYTSRDELLKILGEKHPLHDFLGTLSMKCSYLLFNKEYVREILLEVDAFKSAGNTELVRSCMNLLVVLASFCPLFLAGSEENLLNLLLKEDNEIIKEGIVHVLARAGGNIREQLSKTSSSVELLLERLCLEGSQKQAKYSVQALAAIMKDDGLKSLSVLYKKLVDMLEKKTHMPAVLQSLGCIAQAALPVFETREDEIVDFIMGNILQCSNGEDNTKAYWEEQSELCFLKIFGIKALVKSYLPAKDAHLRLGIEKLFGILKNLSSFGGISKDIKSSAADRAHLRLASAKAILRLSKYWDHKIPVDIFHLTLRTSQEIHPEARKIFLSKVHQYIKEQRLDAKYACAFLFNITGSCPAELKEGRDYLIEVVQMCNQEKACQLSGPHDANSPVAYPEYILAYLVHALAHHPSFPNIDDCKDVQAFEPVYQQLHLFLSVLMPGQKDGQSGANFNKESFFVIMSIFQSIKYSEDIVDVMKSKNSHAICDLGMSIVKRLVHNQADFSESTTSALLPPSLYRSLKKNESDNPEANREQSWLAGYSVLAHFESLYCENEQPIHSDNPNDENIEKAVEDGDGVETQVPLWKVMKHLKSRGTKKKKPAKNPPLDERNNAENDVDILGMVREINLDNLERAKDMEFGRLANDNEHFIRGETAYQKISTKVPVFVKRKKRSSREKSIPVPKSKRPPFGQDIHAWSFSKKSAEGLRKDAGESLHRAEISTLQSFEKPSEAKEMAELTKPDLMLSCSPMIKNSSGHKKKHTESNDLTHPSGAALNHEPKKSSPLIELDEKNSIDNPKISLVSGKKRKRSIGLEKCSSESAEKHKVLIGCRVKIWWPLDKKFYEGVVQSYDPTKNKHVILYDDGDVEVLQLAKERWEVVSNGYTPRKQQKSPSISPSQVIWTDFLSVAPEVPMGNVKHIQNASMSAPNHRSPEQKKGKRPQGSSRQNKNSIKKFRRKTPKKSKEHIHVGISESNIDADSSDTESRDVSDSSNSHTQTVPKVDDDNLENYEWKQASHSEGTEKSEDPKDLKESDEEEKSDSPNAGPGGDSEDEPLSMWKLRAVKVA